MQTWRKLGDVAFAAAERGLAYRTHWVVSVCDSGRRSGAVGVCRQLGAVDARVFGLLWAVDARVFGLLRGGSVRFGLVRLHSDTLLGGQYRSAPTRKMESAKRDVQLQVEPDSLVSTRNSPSFVVSPARFVLNW